ncbi:MAG: glycosyltransferase family 39 protein [Phycisphaerales bacterium]|nr:glycosyltransferase family 39 protein [Phycisphaerales bacterium]
MRSIRHWLLPLVFLLCMTLPHLGQGDWQRTDGAWYGAIAVQAWRTGELWTLHGPPGQPYFNKPPLAFWLHGLSLHAAGPGAHAARLPSVLAACAGLLATVWTVRMLAGRRAALLSGATLSLTAEYLRRTREISLDLWQAAFILFAVALLVRATRTRRSGRAAGTLWACASGASLGAALLTKPLVASPSSRCSRRGWPGMPSGRQARITASTHAAHSCFSRLRPPSRSSWPFPGTSQWSLSTARSSCRSTLGRKSSIVLPAN